MNDTDPVKIGAASAPVSESQNSVTYGHTDARTFVQMSRYVYVKVGLEALVKQFIFRAIL